MGPREKVKGTAVEKTIPVSYEGKVDLDILPPLTWYNLRN